MANYSIMSITQDQEGVYQCKATNIRGTVARNHSVSVSTGETACMAGFVVYQFVFEHNYQFLYCTLCSYSNKKWLCFHSHHDTHTHHSGITSTAAGKTVYNLWFTWHCHDYKLLPLCVGCKYSLPPTH